MGSVLYAGDFEEVSIHLFPRVRWNVETCYVADLGKVIDLLTEAKVYFEEQR